MHNKYPFDMLDLGFMLVAPSHPVFLLLCVGQYVARRSSWVIEAFLEAGVALPDTDVSRALLPGLDKLLPPPDDGQAVTSVGKETQPLVTPAPESTAQTVALGGIANDDNVLVVGPKGSGKTTLLRRMIALRHGQHIALDPHNTPDKWPCSTVGGGLEWGDILRVLTSAYNQMRNRYKGMARGDVTEAQCKQRRYTLVADEYRSISKALPRNKDALGASDILLEILTQGRKAGIAVLVAAHADTVKALGIEGEGDLRTSFDWIVYLGGLATKRVPEAAQLNRPAVAYHPERDTYYLLNVSDKTDSFAQVEKPCAAPGTNNAMLGALLGVVPDDSSTGTKLVPGHQDAVPVVVPGTSTNDAGTSTKSDVGTTSDGPDLELIAALVRAGWSANKIYTKVGGNRRQVLDLVKEMKETMSMSADDDGPDPDIGPFGRYM